MWYNFIMKTNLVSRTEKAEIYFSDSSEINLINVDDDLRKKLGSNWSLGLARIKNNDVTYRFVNYLTTTGLLSDNREKNGSGWRKLSYVDCIYLELVLALRKLGVKVDIIKYLYNTFSERYTPEHAIYMGLDWLDILITVHCGVEMEVIIDVDSSQPLICDTPMMVLFGTRKTNGQIRVSLSAMVNNVRQRNKMTPIAIRQSFGQSGLSNDEFEAVMGVRHLENNDTLTIRRRKNGMHFERIKQEKMNEDLMEQLSSLVGEEFGSISAQTEGGKVVSVKRSIKKVIRDK